MAFTCDPASNLLSTLHSHFGHPSFRPGQQDVVEHVLSGADVLAVMPTGAGKSLGYQLPAVVLPGTTLVVSPLISLMKDQVDELNRRGVQAAALHSMMTVGSRRAALADARAGRLRLLYVAPERFASEEFTRLLAELPVSRFVIDEAHCVSAWGHDFRPDYRRLKAAAASCRSSEGRARPPIAAFTATATPEVRADVIEMLGLESPQVMVAGFDRPNIFLRVERVTGDEQKYDWLPELTCGRRALVYAATRKSTDAAARQLKDAGIDAQAYHAGLKDDERTRVQDAFAAGRLRVVCATNAFGMGIDRPDVDAVVHLAIPGSVEAYYQEIGRAGRDGRAASATLLWDYADVSLRRFLIDSPRPGRPGHRVADLGPEEAEARKAIEHSRLERMIAYADTIGCLRSTVLRYFGDPAARERCDGCGNCRPNAVDAYEHERLRKILNGVMQSGQGYGRRRIIAMLTGDTSDLPLALRDLPATGALKIEDSRTTGLWLEAAISAGLLAVSNDQYRTLRVTENGRAVMMGGTLPADLVRPARLPALAAWPQTRELHTFSRRRPWSRREEW